MFYMSVLVGCSMLLIDCVAASAIVQGRVSVFVTWRARIVAFIARCHDIDHGIAWT